MEKLVLMLKDLFYEDGSLSLTRVIAFGGYFLFAAGSIYLLINNIDWGGYTTFSGYTGGGGAALQFGNKLINSKYNSIEGGYEPKSAPKPSAGNKQ